MQNAESKTAAAPSRNRGLRLGLIGAAGCLFLLACWHYREPLRQRLLQHALLANNAPSIESLEEMILQAPDPQEAILAAWNTSKLVHRQVAARMIANIVPRREPLPSKLEALALPAALDVDMNIRELAFGVLAERNHPALTSLAAAQFHDPDPQARLLGLSYIKRTAPADAVPAVIPLLKDANPLVVVSALKILERWSGENFGVKLAEAVPGENKTTGLTEFSEENRRRAAQGVEKANQWWKTHQKDFPARPLDVPAAALTGRHTLPTVDFSLPNLEGKQVHLSEFRGKVVLINFWTTWCTACVGEMQALIALQKKYGDRLTILGVSLDYVPDEHGHVGEHKAGADDDHDHVSSSDIRAKVARTIKTRGVNYPVLLDEHNTVGGRFNGGELPTTVILDAQGMVRRRFVGARSLPVFDALIEEASQPFNTIAASR